MNQILLNCRTTSQITAKEDNFDDFWNSTSFAQYSFIYFGGRSNIELKTCFQVNNADKKYATTTNYETLSKMIWGVQSYSPR